VQKALGSGLNFRWLQNYLASLLRTQEPELKLRISRLPRKTEFGELEESSKHASETHKKDLSTRLHRWKSFLDREDPVSSTRPVSSVTTSELAAFVGQFQGQTYINWGRVLSNFFGWCVKTGASPENPVAGLDKGNRIQRRPAVMTAATFKNLLSKALVQRRADVLSWLTLGGFCGLRPFETLRIHWSAAQWETREVRVEPETSKTKRARIVALQPVALAWLKLAYEFAGHPSGQVMPKESTWGNRWRHWREKNHDQNWWADKDDVLRHS
jgi:integrase